MVGGLLDGTVPMGQIFSAIPPELVEAFRLIPPVSWSSNQASNLPHSPSAAKVFRGTVRVSWCVQKI